MKWRIPFFDLKPTREEIRAVSRTMASGWYTQGPQVFRFEQEFQRAVGRGHAVAVSSGTAALHLSFLSLGLKAGDRVLMPSLTFVACANIVRLMGAEPVFCDIISPANPTMDPEDVEKKLRTRCRFMVPMHYGGYPCDMKRLSDISKKNGLVLIEDACHAPCVSLHGRPLGAWGATGCFSFFSNKNITTAEGGMILCKDPELAGRLKALRSHGMTGSTWDRHTGRKSSYDVSEPGLNYRMDDMRASLGRVQLRRIKTKTSKRKHLVNRYIRALSDCPNIEIPFLKRKGPSAHHLFVVLFPDTKIRDKCKEQLRRNGIQTSLHYPPIHMFSFYSQKATKPLPKTENFAERALSLPLYPELKMTQIDEICDIIASTITGN